MIITKMKWLSVGLIFVVMLSGCSLIPSNMNNAQKASGTNSESNANNQGASADKSDDATAPNGAQSAKSSGEQIWFDKDQPLSSVPRMSTGGIWYYTQDQHPGNIDDEYEWDEVDVLHIQISDKEYLGYKMEPIGIEMIGGNTAKVIIKLEEDKSDYETDEEEAPRLYVKVKQGALEGKQFIIQTEDGEKLNTN
ncbi:hypothetical protein [Marininema halotolerans]|uniref:Lipoprotein n=1 Tax=Marininema halotolerans TaxID=1155944 RepID=A0A1I6RJ43_9BACL|nr:hypothetical protein [Marininema halotolerans]SFS64759.1 hypothetical protein SAMN05444972_105130 [Marininema halotolerans]